MSNPLGRTKLRQRSRYSYPAFLSIGRALHYLHTWYHPDPNIAVYDGMRADANPPNFRRDFGDRRWKWWVDLLLGWQRKGVKRRNLKTLLGVLTLPTYFNLMLNISQLPYKNYTLSINAAYIEYLSEPRKKFSSNMKSRLVRQWMRTGAATNVCRRWRRTGVWAIRNYFHWPDNYIFWIVSF